MNKTGYYTHPACRLHEMGEGHPECPQRLDAIEDRLLISGVGDALDRREAPAAPLSDIELVHGRMYVAGLRGLADGLRDDIAAGGPRHAQVDPDTAMNIHTWDAALHAAGAAIAATDAVIAGELENAFCAVRPPGHHACRDQAMGFCFINNVALPSGQSLLFASAGKGDALYLDAVGLINEHRYEDAIAALTAAQASFGPHPDILTYLGFANRKLKRSDAAEAYYLAALAVAPNHRGATEYYGELMVERGDLAGARLKLALLDAQCQFGCAEAEELRRWIAAGHSPHS